MSNPIRPLPQLRSSLNDPRSTGGGRGGRLPDVDGLRGTKSSSDRPR